MLTVDGCGLVHARYCINLMLYIFNGRLTWTAGRPSVESHTFVSSNIMIDVLS